MTTKEEVSELVTQEMSHITDARLIQKLSELLVEPRCEFRAWDYGTVATEYACWMVMEHSPSNTGIAFCEQGFGPACPWGLLWLSGNYMSIGMDSGWYPTLESAMRESMAWEIPNPAAYEVP